MPEVFFHSEKVTLTFDERIPCIIWEPVGLLKGEQFREPFRIGMDYLEMKIKSVPNITWLNDTRKFKNASQEDVKWLNKNVNDRVYKLGTRRVAFVLPDNIFGKWAIKIYVDFTKKRPDNKLDIKAFDEINEAREWLKNGITSKDVSFI